MACVHDVFLISSLVIVFLFYCSFCPVIDATISGKVRFVAADALPLKTGVVKAPVAFPIRVPDVRKASSHKLFLLIFPAVEQVRHHIHDIRLYIVFRSQDGVADVLLLLDDPVELLVDRLSSK